MQGQTYVRIERNDADSRFPSFLQGFNRRWLAPNCEAVYLCLTADGTAKALDDALARHGGGVKIKSGGHCYEDFVFSDDTRAVLDVTPMAGAGFDDRRGFYLDAGGNNWDAFEALFRNYAKVLPAGSCYSVGLGGHICGGGYGLLSRLHGLTVDWLTGVELVVKDDPDLPARKIYVSTDSLGEEADLYWAQRGGGGGNFGVITRYYFAELPNAPNKAVISTLAWDWKTLTARNLGSLLACYAKIAARQDNRALFGLFKLNHQASSEIQLVLQVAAEHHDATRAAHQDVVLPLHRELADVLPHRPVQVPIVGHVGWVTVPPSACPTAETYTFYEAAQTLNGSGPNLRGKYKSAYMRRPFPSDQVEAIFEHLKQVPDGLDPSDMSQSLLQVDSYGGAINDVASDATAIPQRDSILKLQYQTYWQDPAKDAGHLAWIRDFYSAVYNQTGGVPDPALDPNNNVDGCYYNYPDVDLNTTVGRNGALRLYFLENLDRLVTTKRRWDPCNYFHNEQSIPTQL